MKWILIMISAAVIAGAGPATVEGQVCGTILSCIGSQYSHGFTALDNNNEEHPQHPIDDEDCYVCLDGGSPVPPEICHPECLSLENEDQLAFSRLITEAGSGDLRRTIAAAQRATRFVLINTGRRSLQILSCDGSTIVANLPLGDLFDDAVGVLPQRTAIAIAAQVATQQMVALRLIQVSSSRTPVFTSRAQPGKPSQER